MNPTERIIQHLYASDARAEKAAEPPWIKENHFMYPDGPLLKTTKGMHVCYGIGIAANDEIDFIASARTELPRANNAIQVLMTAYNNPKDYDRERVLEIVADILEGKE